VSIGNLSSDLPVDPFSGSESRANSGGSAQDNVVSKGIRGSSSSSLGWNLIQRRRLWDVKLE
jgi:hypothetical protein